MGARPAAPGGGGPDRARPPAGLVVSLVGRWGYGWPATLKRGWPSDFARAALSYGIAGLDRGKARATARQVQGKGRGEGAREGVIARPSGYPVVARYSAGEICDGTARGPARRGKAGRTAVAACGRGAPRALRHSVGAGVAAACGARHRGGAVPGIVMARS